MKGLSEIGAPHFAITIPNLRPEKCGAPIPSTPFAWNRLAALFSLSVLLVSCGEGKPASIDSLTGGPRVTPDSNAITIPSGRLLFQDDFMRRTSGWDIFDESQASAAYLNGEYQLRLKRTPLRTWGLLRAVPATGDVTLSVAGRLVAGADSGGYGLLCRFSDADHYYFFLVTGEGQFIIGKQSGGAPRGLSASTFQPSEAILPGNVPNLLIAQCLGDRLSLSINAQPVAEVRDDEFQKGQVGMLAAAVESQGMEARFDDFSIYTGAQETQT